MRDCHRPSRRLRRFLLAASLLLVALPGEAVVSPRSAELSVSQPEGARQTLPAAVIVPSGSVVAWADERLGIVVRSFDAEGEPVAPSMVLAASDPLPRLPFSNVRLSERLEPALAGRGDDTFLLAHVERVANRSADIFFDQRVLVGSSVHSRLYRLDGSTMARPVLLAGPETFAERPLVTAADSGFWAAWEQRGAETGLFVRRLNPRGQPSADAVRVSPTGELVALGASGDRALAVWIDGIRFHARVIDADGQPVGTAFVVSPRRARPTGTAAVAAGPDGDFMVVVQHSAALSAKVFGQRVSRDGAPGPSVMLNGATGDAYTAPEIVPLDGSRWLVTWITQIHNFRVAVEYGVFGAGWGALERGVINERPISYQLEMALAASGGRALAVWEGYDQRNARSLRARVLVDEPPPERPRRRR